MESLLSNVTAVFLQSARMFRELVPYVIVGAALGAAARGTHGIPVWERVERLGQGVLLPAASLLGTFSPLCTMGTVPLLAGLVGRGLPAGVMIAFLASSSMVSPQLFVLTVGTVGIRLALARWLAALSVGISAGWLAGAAARRGWSVYTPRLARIGGSGHSDAAAGFWSRLLDQLEFVAIHLVVGVILAAGINVFVPAGFLVRWLGSGNPFAVVVSALLAIPFYVCGGGILPTMQVLMEKGVPGGVVLAFFVSGPATRIQVLAALAAALSRRCLSAYVVLVMLWAVIFGIAFNWAVIPA